MIIVVGNHFLQLVVQIGNIGALVIERSVVATLIDPWDFGLHNESQAVALLNYVAVVRIVGKTHHIAPKFFDNIKINVGLFVRDRRGTALPILMKTETSQAVRFAIKHKSFYRVKGKAPYAELCGVVLHFSVPLPQLYFGFIETGLQLLAGKVSD